MASSRNRGLQRRLAALTEATRRKIRDREDLRDKAKVWAVIRAALAVAGIPRIEPDLPGQWATEAAEAELARLGDSPELQRADAAFIAQDPRMEPRESWAVRIADRIPLFAGQPPPEPGRGSLSDWYAWSLARRAVSVGRKSAAPSAKSALFLSGCSRRMTLRLSALRPAIA